MAGRFLFVVDSFWVQQPKLLVHHAVASVASDGTPREVINRGNRAAMWAGDAATIATGASVSGDAVSHWCHL